MLVKTLLNRIEHFKSFIFCTEKMEDINGSKAIVIEIKPRANSKPECPICRKCCECYDKRDARFFEYVPIWTYKVFFWYEPRRVICPTHKVKVEYMPWVIGKEQMTTSYKIYLSRWAKRLSWKETSEIFKTSTLSSLKFRIESLQFGPRAGSCKLPVNIFNLVIPSSLPSVDFASYDLDVRDSAIEALPL